MANSVEFQVRNCIYIGLEWIGVDWSGLKWIGVKSSGGAFARPVWGLLAWLLLDAPPLGVRIIRMVEVVIFLVIGEVIEHFSLLLTLLGRCHFSRVLLAPLGTAVLKPHLNRNHKSHNNNNKKQTNKKKKKKTSVTQWETQWSVQRAKSKLMNWLGRATAHRGVTLYGF